VSAPRTITRPCRVCGEVFTAPVKRGPRRTCCDRHWYRAIRNKRARRTVNGSVRVVPVKLLPSTGIAIARRCLCCRNPFTAHHEAALYCGLECFTRDHNRKPPRPSPNPNRRAREARHHEHP
jgi:hypothetical protein